MLSTRIGSKLHVAVITGLVYVPLTLDMSVSVCPGALLRYRIVIDL